MMMIVEQLVERMSGRGNWSTGRKPAPVPLSTTDPTWFYPGSNPNPKPGLCGRKPATNRLSCGTTFTCYIPNARKSYSNSDTRKIVIIIFYRSNPNSHSKSFVMRTSSCLRMQFEGQGRFCCANFLPPPVAIFGLSTQAPQQGSQDTGTVPKQISRMWLHVIGLAHQ
jgi:hypothetical protein